MSNEDPRILNPELETTPDATPPRPGVRPAILPPPRHLLAVALGGVLGGLLRASLVQTFPTPTGTFPFTVFAENVTGAFALGLILAFLLRREAAPPTGRKPPRDELRPLLCTGVLGAYTTFSTLTLDIVHLSGAGEMGLALAYALGSIAVGLAAAALGLRWGRALAARPLSRSSR